MDEILPCRLERATSSMTWARRRRYAGATHLPACDLQQSARSNVTLSEGEGYGERARNRRSARSRTQAEADRQRRIFGLSAARDGTPHRHGGRELTCAALRGQGESGLNEGSIASRSSSGEFRRTAASNSRFGRAAQARHVLRSRTVGSSWATRGSALRPLCGPSREPGGPRRFSACPCIVSPRDRLLVSCACWFASASPSPHLAPTPGERWHTRATVHL